MAPALQAWFDGLPDHVTVSFGNGACYRIEETLKLDGRQHLVIDGNGATLRAFTAGTGGRLAKRGRAQLNIVRSRDIVVEDLIVRGANPHAGLADDAYQPDLEAQHAFSLLSDDTVTLRNVQAYDTYGDFVYIGGTVGAPSIDVTVTDSHFERSGRQGISVTDGDNVTITNNTIGYVRRSLIDLEPNTRPEEVKHIDIEHNTSGPVRNYWLAVKGSGINISAVVASHNVMAGPSGALVLVAGPAFGKRGPFTFEDNVLRTTGVISDEDAKGAFLFVNVRGVTIRGNRLTVSPTAQLAGVELRATDDVQVSGNQFVGTTQPMLTDTVTPTTKAPRAP